MFRLEACLSGFVVSPPSVRQLVKAPMAVTTAWETAIDPLPGSAIAEDLS